MSRRTSKPAQQKQKQQQPDIIHIIPLSAREIARLDRDADAFLLVADAEALAERVAEAARHKTETTPAQLLKNDRKREEHGKGVAVAPKDRQGRARKPDANCSEPMVKVHEEKLAECFQKKAPHKTWGDLEWAEQSGFGADPADIYEEQEEYELAGGDAAAKAEAEAEAEENERLKKEAIGLLHPRDQARVRKFLAGVSVAEIAAEEDASEQCIYKSLSRSEQRITVLLEYRRQCKIWAITGGERPNLPEIDDGASAEQIELFCDADAGSGEDDDGGVRK
ncbi:MAG: hypothetical protein M0Z50_09270 [Planctomycetia bacterium]|nr:hypothetical protein [Planctomycetia bacterium]